MKMRQQRGSSESQEERRCLVRCTEGVVTRGTPAHRHTRQRSRGMRRLYLTCKYKRAVFARYGFLHFRPNTRNQIPTETTCFQPLAPRFHSNTPLRPTAPTLLSKSLYKDGLINSTKRSTTLLLATSLCTSTCYGRCTYSPPSVHMLPLLGYLHGCASRWEVS